MSSEIADNKWEVQASKPPVATAGGIAQMVMFAGFAGLFGYLTIMSIIGAMSPKPEENRIEKQFSKKKAADEAPAAPVEKP